MMDVAFFRLPGGRAWMGEGPFTASATTPEEPAFYINDFALTDAGPWKIPARLTEIKSGEELGHWLAGCKPPRIAWQNPGIEWFKMVFRRIRRDVLAQRLRKMVPVLTEHGTLLSGDMAALLAQICQAPSGFWAYARIEGDGGFLGATPELLLSRTGAELQTMALAGTARPAAGDDFTTDIKEIEEHELVADFIAERLGEVGEVRRSPREVSTAGALTHFRTKFSCALNGNPDDGELVRLLHPTPAVGCLPRDEISLRKLTSYRQQLEADDFFGAPFGFRTGGEFHCAVGIRGLSWQEKNVMLPCGCGIVAGSAFDHEWRELRQKRDAVANLLGV